MRFIHQDEKRTINNQIGLLNGTLVKVENLIANQRERVNLAKKINSGMAIYFMKMQFLMKSLKQEK